MMKINSNSNNNEIANIPLMIENNFPFFKFVKYLGSNNMVIVQDVNTQTLINLRLVPNVERNEYTSVRKFFYQMEKISHPNILKYFQIFYLKEENILVMTSQFGDLSFQSFMNDRLQKDRQLSMEYLKRIMHEKIPHDRRVYFEYFKQILQGVKYLHRDIRITHGNLKLSNLLMIDDLIKIADFRELKPHFANPAIWNSFEAIEYSPPEILLFKDLNNFSEKTDIWALGIILHKMLTNQKHPFIQNGSNSMSGLEKITQIKSEFSKNTRCFDQSIDEPLYLELLDQCLQYDPGKRPNIIQLLQSVKDLEEKSLVKINEEEFKDDAYASKIPIKSLTNGLENYGVKDFDIDKTQYLYLNSQKGFFLNFELLSLFTEVIKLDYFNLLELNLNGNVLGELNKKHFGILLDGLKNNKTIQKLEMNRNSLGKNSEEFKLLCNALKNMKLMALLMSENLIGLHALNLKYLSEVVIENEGLTNLDLSMNYLGKYSENMGFFWECLKEHKNLSDLNLGRNDLGNFFDSIKLLSDGIKYNKSLKCIDLSSNLLGKELQNIDNLTYSFKVNKSLSIISLANNDLGNYSAGIAMFAEVIMMTKKWTDLNLSTNNLGKNSKNIKYLAKALKDNTSLLKVNLSSNKLGVELINLCGNLVFNETITHLVLSDNSLGIDLDITKTLAEYLKINENLEILDLSNNDFGSDIESMRTLLEALKYNISIKVLFLNNVNLNKRVENLYVLASFLKANSNINTVYLFNNEITDIDEEKFMRERGHISVYR